MPSSRSKLIVWLCRRQGVWVVAGAACAAHAWLPRSTGEGLQFLFVLFCVLFFKRVVLVASQH